MKSITIAGNIGKAAELRQTQNGDAVASFNVAVNDKRDKDQTYWFTCTLWGKRAQALSQYLTKGQKVTVQGDLTTREYEGKTYLQVNVADVVLQGGKPDNGGQSQGGYGGGANPNANRDLGDEIPFNYNYLG